MADEAGGQPTGTGGITYSRNSHSAVANVHVGRARAIETQCYLLACAQWGAFPGPDGRPRPTYGHSLVADPWGHVVAKASDGVGPLSATVDPAQIRRVRGLIPMNEHRRLHAL